MVNSTQESLGAFSKGVHEVSGTVKAVADKTDASPDLCVYLAEDKAAKEFISFLKLDKIETFTLDIPTNGDFSKQKYVLI